MKILIAGNANYGLAEALKRTLAENELSFASRSTGFDFLLADQRERFAAQAVENDVIILCSSLQKFGQTLLLESTYKKLKDSNKSNLIICIGSTTDRYKKGMEGLYNAEKKALRDYCNSLGLIGVWDRGPRVTLISYGSLSNTQHKFPDRKMLDISKAAQYVKWVLDQPSGAHINELSVDTVQS